MDKEYTHIAMIIDRSGSMSSCWSDVVGGYKTIVEDNQKLEGKCTFTLVAFDDRYEVIEDFTPISDVNSTLSIRPRGSTALLDAIGKTIVSVGEKLASMKESLRPMKVCIMIQTDGYENASREFKKEDIQKLIKEQSDKYSWEFMFLGASLASVEEARSYGIKANNVSVYDSYNNTGDTFTLLGEKMSNMRSAESMVEYSAAVAFTDDEKLKMNDSRKKETAETK